MMRATVVTFFLAFGWVACGNLDAARTAADAQNALWRRMLEAEDARGATAEGIAPLVEGLRAPDPELRRTAVRALGRLERDTLVSTIAGMLEDSAASVRAEAANALGQAVSRGDPAAARAVLLGRADRETDAFVRGLIAETLGRLRQADGAHVAATARTIAALAGGGASIASAPPDVRLGVARGLHFLVRQPAARGAMPPEAVARLRELATTGAGDASLQARRLRTVAAAALIASGSATPADLAAILDDPAPWVRREAAAGLAGPAPGAPVSLLAGVLADTAATVRYEGVRALGRQRPAPQACASLLEKVSDPADEVALLAIDLLGGCDSEQVVARLTGIAESLPDPPARWHRSAHALVTLARLRPAATSARSAPFVSSPDFFVRTYAAQAAALAGDTATLRALAADAHANVRTAAVSGLSALAGHGADAVYIAQLGRDDSQLLMEASKALEGSADARALPALLDALSRVTAQKRETSRDGRMALLERIGGLGGPANADALRPWLSDFDPAIAARAAEIIGRWSGTAPVPAPVTLPRRPLPTRDELRALEQARVVLHMQSGDSIVIALFPFDAPTNTARFVRLARTGAFNWRTFHRVVPNFVIQGGSPGANEYAGDASFTRDELGLRYNWRGTVGLSTRGRDTGDAQIYVNLIDNVRLDHDYTIYGEVVSGLDALDGVQEGAVIARTGVR